MVKVGKWQMGGIKTFGSFQAMNFGRTLVVSFQILSLVFGGQVYRKKDEIKVSGNNSKGN